MDTQDSTTTKRCTKCGVHKTLESFNKDASKRDKLCSWCKVCVAASTKSWREANPEKAKAIRNAWAAANPERRAEYMRLWAENNRENRNLYQKRWSEKNKDYRKNWNEANKDHVAKTNKSWAQANPDKRKASMHRRLARQHKLPDAFTSEDWQTALDYFGGCCAVCGRQPGLWHTLAMDHWIPLSDPDCPGTVPWNIVPLCHGDSGCNNSKHNRPANDWLIERFGKRKGRAILQRIEAYLQSRGAT